MIDRGHDKNYVITIKRISLILLYICFSFEHFVQKIFDHPLFRSKCRDSLEFYLYACKQTYSSYRCSTRKLIETF